MSSHATMNVDTESEEEGWVITAPEEGNLEKGHPTVLDLNDENPEKGHPTVFELNDADADNVALVAAKAFHCSISQRRSLRTWRLFACQSRQTTHTLYCSGIQRRSLQAWRAFASVSRQTDESLRVIDEGAERTLYSPPKSPRPLKSNSTEGELPSQQTTPNPPPTVAPSRPQPKSFRKAKLILIGNANVGKTCLARRAVTGTFSSSTETTVGVAFSSHRVAFQDTHGKPQGVEFAVWDTAGAERYRTFTSVYFRNAAVAVVVYDITCPESFAGAQSWLKEVLENCRPLPSIALVGNKADLEEQRCVPTARAAEFAAEHNLFFMETSAKQGSGVSSLFEAMAQDLPIPPDSPTAAVSLASQPTTKKNKAGKCACG